MRRAEQAEKRAKEAEEKVLHRAEQAEKRAKEAEEKAEQALSLHKRSSKLALLKAQQSTMQVAASMEQAGMYQTFVWFLLHGFG